MKYAVIQLGGKQFKVSEGDIFKIDRQENLEVDVLLLSEDDKVLVGKPYLKDVVVKTKVLENKLDDKILVIRFKAKSRYRKRKGHRQPISIVEIESIKKKGIAKPKKIKKDITKKTKATVSKKVVKKVSKKAVKRTKK